VEPAAHGAGTGSRCGSLEYTNRSAAGAAIDPALERVVARYDVPDALAWDPGWRRLYVAAESGVLSVWWLDLCARRVTMMCARLR
jgi:hypothetical protein